MYNIRQKINSQREKSGCINGTYCGPDGGVEFSTPYYPRPNYEWNSTSNTFVQNGYIKETSKRNYYKENSITGDVTNYTKEYLVPDVQVMYSSSGNILLDSNPSSAISNLDSSTNFTTSFFIKKVGGTTSEMHFTRRWYWAPELIIDLDKGVIASGQLTGFSFTYYGNGWYRLGGWICSLGSITQPYAALLNRVNASDDIEVIVTCNMCEIIDDTNIFTSGSNTYFYPSTWIPYDSERIVLD